MEDYLQIYKAVSISAASFSDASFIVQKTVLPIFTSKNYSGKRSINN